MLRTTLESPDLKNEKLSTIKENAQFRDWYIKCFKNMNYFSCFCVVILMEFKIKERMKINWNREYRESKTYWKFQMIRTHVLKETGLTNTGI